MFRYWILGPEKRGGSKRYFPAGDGERKAVEARDAGPGMGNGIVEDVAVVEVGAVRNDCSRFSGFIGARYWRWLKIGGAGRWCSGWAIVVSFSDVARPPVYWWKNSRKEVRHEAFGGEPRNQGQNP